MHFVAQQTGFGGVGMSVSMIPVFTYIVKTVCTRCPTALTALQRGNQSHRTGSMSSMVRRPDAVWQRALPCGSGLVGLVSKNLYQPLCYRAHLLDMAIHMPLHQLAPAGQETVLSVVKRCMHFGAE